MIEGIGNLSVIKLNLGIIHSDTISLAIVNRRVLDPQFLHADIAGIHHDTIVGTMQVGIFQLVVLGETIESYALPLPRSTVVWEIIKHVVYAIATQGDRFLRRTIRQQLAINIYPGILMKIKRRPFLNLQSSQAIHLDSTIDDNRLLVAIGIRLTQDKFLTTLHLHVSKSLSIPRHRPQVDLLLRPALQCEDQVVLHQLRLIFLLLSGSQLHEYSDAISLANLHVTCLIANSLPKKSTIHVDTEPLLVATLQTDVATANPLACAVIHPHRLGRRRDVRESRVELHGIGGEREQICLRSRKVLVVHT